MKVSCPSCNATLNIDDKKVPAGGARIKCPTCQTVFPLRPGAPTSSAAVPLPGSKPSLSPSVPLPGSKASLSPSVPLPGSTPSAGETVPLPAAPHQAQDWENEPTRAVAMDRLPEEALPAAIPGATMRQAPPSNVAPSVRTSGSSGVVSLPDPLNAALPAAGVPLPGSANPAPRSGGALPGPRVAAHHPEGVPLPGGSVDGAEDGAATVMNVPVYAPPGAPAPSGTVPLPGGSPGEPNPWEEEWTKLDRPRNREDLSHVPLPGGLPPAPGRPIGGNDAGAAVPLPHSASGETVVGPPGTSVASPGSVPTAQKPGSARGVPLPGSSGAAPSPRSERGVPLPGAVERLATARPAVALPGSSEEEPTHVGIPSTGGLGTAPGRKGAVPLPGSDLSSLGMEVSGAAQGGEVGPAGTVLDDIPESTDFESVSEAGDAARAQSASAGTAEQLPDPNAFELDFDAGSPSGFDAAPVPPDPTAALGEPAPAGFELPAPPEDGADLSFGALPSSSEVAPAPAVGESLDFSAPATSAPALGEIAAHDLAFDFAQPPPPQQAPLTAPPSSMPEPVSPLAGFGEVDFGEDGPADSGQQPHAGDALADLLSAPTAAPETLTAPADGLEMLSFIDEPAASHGVSEPTEGVRRFHVKRRSGKTFGPFEEAALVKMLEEGQLLGNEETSADGEHWQPIGTEPAFQAVIARLMEAPAPKGPSQVVQPAEESKPKGPSMERLKQLYEGRMAAVAVVQSKEPVPITKRLPLIAAGVLAVAVVAGGVALGVATPYGFFGLKKIFPATVKSGSREAEYLAGARRGFLTDTWKSYRSARDDAARALQAKEYPEARAVWCQAVFYLKRRYNWAEAAELGRAADELPNVKLLGDKHPDVLKAFAGDALTRRDADGALALVDEALARQENQGDIELLFLRAEAYAQKKQTAQARAEYDQVLKRDPKSVRALHALGALHKGQAETEPALQRYSEALAIDPDHLSSALDSAEIHLVTRPSPETKRRGLSAIAQVLEKKESLAPSELGKALALKAEGLVVDGKVSEAVPLFEEALKADANDAFSKARLGNAYLMLHQPDKALPLYEAATNAVPDNLAYLQGYLSALIGTGKFDQANKAVQAATTRFPGNGALAYLSGRVADALDKPKDAEDAYQRAIAADPENADAYLYLARLFLRFRRFAEVGPVLEQGLKKQPSNPALRVGRGELAFHERDLNRAEAEFKEALAADPHSAEAHLGESKVAMERGEYELAAAKVDKALEIDPRVGGGALQKGLALWRVGRLEESIAHLEKARADEPKNVTLTVTLGAVELDHGQLDKAQQHLQSALQFEPSHPDGNFYLGRLKNARQEHSQAIEAVRKAIDANPKSPQYRYWMGRVYADARKPSEAMEEWKTALELDPAYVDVLVAMGQMHFDRATASDLKKAVGLFEKALELDPKRSAVRAAIGDTQMKLENWDDAIASYQRALEEDSGGKLRAVNFHLGQAYQEKKKWDKAIEWYRKATELEEKNADAWLNMAYIYKGTKKPKEAVACFKKYLEIRPDDEHKKEVEDEIYFLRGDK